MESGRIAVSGMSCGHCVARVRKALEEVEGVKVESVDIGEARLTWDPGRVDRERIVAAVQSVGYSAGWRAGPPEDAKRPLRPS